MAKKGEKTGEDGEDLEDLDEDLAELFKDIDKGAAKPAPAPAPEAGMPIEGEMGGEELTMEEEAEEEEPYDPRPLILKIRGQEGNRVEFEIGKQSHGFCNLLRRELLEDQRIIVAAYKYNYFDALRFIVELGDIKDLKDVLTSATQRIRSN
ncbi:MAG TPA: RpoL/Rpb11 RNA polymerase subunit family protein, partial [Candidatus Lokiarchaeia archaeon]|nr:RpoL/Rpb11 RNA polymerase subunit family protein [Candidatus Lokiarchaeia archaeon]